MKRLKEMTTASKTILMPIQYACPIENFGNDSDASCEEVKVFEHGLIAAIANQRDECVWVTATQEDICNALVSIGSIESYEMRKSGVYVTYWGMTYGKDYGGITADHKEMTKDFDGFLDTDDVALMAEIMLEVFRTKKTLDFPKNEISIKEFLGLEIIQQYKYIKWASRNLNYGFGWFRKFYFFSNGYSPIFSFDSFSGYEREMLKRGQLLRSLIPDSLKEERIMNQLTLDLKVFEQA
jgi:hypothetical protein